MAENGLMMMMVVVMMLMMSMWMARISTLQSPISRSVEISCLGISAISFGGHSSIVLHPQPLSFPPTTHLLPASSDTPSTVTWTIILGSTLTSFCRYPITPCHPRWLPPETYAHTATRSPSPRFPPPLVQCPSPPATSSQTMNSQSIPYMHYRR